MSWANDGPLLRDTSILGMLEQVRTKLHRYGICQSDAGTYIQYFGDTQVDQNKPLPSGYYQVSFMRNQPGIEPADESCNAAR